MDIKIEDGIPIPENNVSKYSFIDNMKIGQSFTVPYEEQARSRYGQAFRTRTMKCVCKREGLNLRIWRIR